MDHERVRFVAPAEKYRRQERIGARTPARDKGLGSAAQSLRCPRTLHDKN